LTASPYTTRFRSIRTIAAEDHMVRGLRRQHPLERLGLVVLVPEDENLPVIGTALRQAVCRSDDDGHTLSFFHVSRIDQHASGRRNPELLVHVALLLLRRAESLRVHTAIRSEEHTSELQSRDNLVCR